MSKYYLIHNLRIKKKKVQGDPDLSCSSSSICSSFFTKSTNNIFFSRPNMQKVVYVLLQQHAERYWQMEHGDEDFSDSNDDGEIRYHNIGGGEFNFNSQCKTGKSPSLNDT